MTGPEHFQEAERLITLALEQRLDERTDDVAPRSRLTMAQAQVHATLALAAATAEPIAQSYDGDYDTTIPAAWSEAIS